MSSMNNGIKQAMHTIEIPEELSKRSKLGISQAKQEQKKRNRVKGLGIAVALFVSIGTFTLLNNPTTNHSPTPIVTEEGAVHLPAITLPEENSVADMIGLIVYNGNIYTQTRTEIDVEAIEGLIGEKLGITKGTIDEWSKQEAYDEEFASTIGVADVYSVKGYDKEFRIMTYREQDGKMHAEFYEHLNGITIKSGEDIFGKLNIKGNIASAYYRTFNDWDNDMDHHQPITDMDTVTTFVTELYHAKPLSRTEESDPIGHSRSDEQFRELSLKLNDGTIVRLTLLKGGYIYYGFMNAYFKMEEDDFSKLWATLN
jgi:hypothetical protein